MRGGSSRNGDASAGHPANHEGRPVGSTRTADPVGVMHQGSHPHARRRRCTPRWVVVGAVDGRGEEVEAVPLGATVAAMPIVGGYAEYLCLPATELVRVPPELDPAEAVCL